MDQLGRCNHSTTQQACAADWDGDEPAGTRVDHSRPDGDVMPTKSDRPSEQDELTRTLTSVAFDIVIWRNKLAFGSPTSYGGRPWSSTRTKCLVCLAGLSRTRLRCRPRTG